MIDILALIYVVSMVISVVDFIRHYRKDKLQRILSVKEYLLTAFLIFTPVINTIVALFIIAT